MIRKTLMISAGLIALAGVRQRPDQLRPGQTKRSAEANTPAARQFRAALAEAPKHGLTTDMFFKGDIAVGQRGGAAQGRDGARVGAGDGQDRPDQAWRSLHACRGPRSTSTRASTRPCARTSWCEWLSSLAPQTDEYRKLSQAFVHYVELAAKTPDTNIPPGEPIKRGSDDPRVPAVIEALQGRRLHGAAGRNSRRRGPERRAKPSRAGGTAYTAEVAEAVKRMQTDFGLKPDGVIGNETLKAVNTSAKDRARQLAVALERLRWLERAGAGDPDRRQYRGGHPRLLARRPADRRAARRGRPAGLGNAAARLADVPAGRQPDLDGSGIDRRRRNCGEGRGLFPSRTTWFDKGRPIVQQPGPENSLGQVKFDMKNGEAIYLHDTPAKALFGRTSATAATAACGFTMRSNSPG